MPLLVIGGSDANKKYHLLCLSLSADESEASVSNTFNFLLEHCNENGIEVDIRSWTVDHGKQFINPIKSLFPQSIKLDCFFHVASLFKKKLKTNDSVQQEMLGDLYIMQKSPTKKIFEKLIKMFKNKYSTFNGVSDELKYIVDNHLEKNFNWYEGAYVYGPSTNNGTESFNSLIKRKYCKQKKQKIDSFLKVLFNIIEDAQKKPVNDVPEYSHLNLETTDTILEQEYAEKIIRFFVDENEIPNGSSYYVFISDETNDIANKYGGISLRTIRSYGKLLENIKIVFYKAEINSWRCLSCTCGGFLKNKQCGHILKILRIQNKTNVVEVPLEGQKRRGRPKLKSTKCTPEFFKNR